MNEGPPLFAGTAYGDPFLEVCLKNKAIDHGIEANAATMAVDVRGAKDAHLLVIAQALHVGFAAQLGVAIRGAR